MPLPCGDDLHQHATYCISLSLLTSFIITKIIPQPPGLLLCSLHDHYVCPPASAAPLTRKLPAMCLVPRRPPTLAVVPPSEVYIVELFEYVEQVE